MSKKSQAALEFLTTYGWAILVLMIMISAFAYFGILNPSILLPERCTFGTEVECMDFLITGGASGTIDLRLKNNIGETITTSGINASTESDPTTSLCTAVDESNWQSGTWKDISFANCDFTDTGVTAGNKGKVLITMTYYATKSGSSYLHDVHGEVYANVR